MEPPTPSPSNATRGALANAARGALGIDWDGCDRRRWDAALDAAGDSALEQSWAYGDAIAAMPGHRVRRAVVHDGAVPVALVQMVERSFPPLGTLVRLTRGPLWLGDGPDADRRRAAFALIRNSVRIRRRELLVWMPELPDSAASETLMRACGARRMVTGYSSIRIDLSQDAAALRAGLRGPWRRWLKLAERSRLRVDMAHGGPKLDWLLANYDAFRRRARFVGPPPALIRAFGEAGRRRRDLLVLRAVVGGEPIAGIILLRHGGTATYYVGWTGAEGRRWNAHTLLLWRGLLALKENGVAWFDLGGVNAHSAPGVARFKLGMGGELFTLSGTYI